MHIYSIALSWLVVGLVSAELQLQDRSVEEDDQQDASPMIQQLIESDRKAQKSTEASKLLSSAVTSSTQSTTPENSEDDEGTDLPAAMPLTQSSTTMETSGEEGPGTDVEKTTQSSEGGNQEPAIEEVLKNNWRLLRALARKKNADFEEEVLQAENWMLLSLLEKKRAGMTTTTTEPSAEADNDKGDRETREFDDHQNETMSAQNSTMAASAVVETSTAHQAANVTDSTAAQRVGKGNFDEPSDNEDFSADVDEDTHEDDQVGEVIRQNWIKLSSAPSTATTTVLPSTSQLSTAITAPSQGAFLEDDEEEGAEEEVETTTKRSRLLWWRKAQLKSTK
ncbi:hypothetical protein RvY_03897 [Ramazzottius varieornatus]|uniref:Uncharacterized protein n=1 Tax=Ramazzottius varieornatus TaxID=947166 RepID=A0A1D1UWP9_RAMVA|nr:hypothetical protein RvY_03897 [Ramazzottius varieornatus]